MTYNQGPQYLPKLGHPSAQPQGGIDPALIEAIAQALQEQQMRSQVGAQDPAQYFQQGRQQTPGSGMDMSDPVARENWGRYLDAHGRGPNALTGGQLNYDTSFFGDASQMDPQMLAGSMQDMHDRGQPAPPSYGAEWDNYLRAQGRNPGASPEEGAPLAAEGMVGLTTDKPKAKKGEFSDFFKVLKAAKSGDKDIKKGFKDLAKQLVTEEAGNAETTIATS